MPTDQQKDLLFEARSLSHQQLHDSSFEVWKLKEKTLVEINQIKKQ